MFSKEFLGIALSGWRWLLGSTCVAVWLSIVLLRFWPPEFTAAMVVGPISRIGAAAMGGRAPFSAVAIPMTEYGPGDESLSDFARFSELLTSPPVSQALIDNNPDLLPKIFPERWDAPAKQWRLPSGFAAAVKQAFLWTIKRQDWVAPDAKILSDHLKQAAAIAQVGTTPMRRISYRHPDRAFALNLIEALVENANRRLRQEAERRIATQTQFIKARLETVTQVEHRRALASLLADQERLALMIEVDLPLAADIITPPFAAGEPDWPNPFSLLPAAAAAGLAFGFLVIMIKFEPSSRTPHQSSPAPAPEPHEYTHVRDYGPPRPPD